MLSRILLEKGVSAFTEIVDRIAYAIANVEDSQTLDDLVNQALERVPAVEILEKGLRKGVHDLGLRYEAGEFFLSELLYGASLIDQAMKLVAPHLKAERPAAKGRIVLGTVSGDIHDIGKNIFKMMAEASGFDVYDLGVDVSSEKFLEAVTKHRPNVLGISSLLTTTMLEMGATVEELKKGGVREGVKVLLGGNAVTETFRKTISADAAALDAVQGVDFCLKWVSG